MKGRPLGGHRCCDRCDHARHARSYAEGRGPYREEMARLLDDDKIAVVRIGNLGALDEEDKKRSYQLYIAKVDPQSDLETRNSDAARVIVLEMAGLRAVSSGPQEMI